MDRRPHFLFAMLVGIPSFRVLDRGENQRMVKTTLLRLLMVITAGLIGDILMAFDILWEAVTIEVVVLIMIYSAWEKLRDWDGQ